MYFRDVRKVRTKKPGLVQKREDACVSRRSCWGGITPRHRRCPGVCAAAERRGRTGLRAAPGHGERGPAARPCGHAGERHRRRAPGATLSAGPRHGPGRVLLSYITGRHGLVLLGHGTGSRGFCSVTSRGDTGWFCSVISQEATPGLHTCSFGFLSTGKFDELKRVQASFTSMFRSWMAREQCLLSRRERQGFLCFSDFCLHLLKKKES